MRADALPWLGALELAGLIRDRAVSPVEVAEAVLARIERLNPRLNAFCAVAHDGARAAAREAEIAVMKGEPIGPLCGVPVSVKDVLPTRGLASTGGSRLFADDVPSEDAIAVGRLRAAGAVIVGKTNTSEFGHKAVTDNPLFGPTRNPWNPSLTPGGSSGGAAAAVASGQGPIGLGTGGGGAVRVAGLSRRSREPRLGEPRDGVRHDRGGAVVRGVGRPAARGRTDLGPDLRQAPPPRRRDYGPPVLRRPELGARVLARGARVPRALRPPADADGRGAPLRGRGTAPARDRRGARHRARVDAVHLSLQPDGPAGGERAGRRDRARAPGGPADRRATPRRSGGAGRGRGLRGGLSVGGAAAARRVTVGGPAALTFPCACPTIRPMTARRDYDAIIVGASFAGLAVARRVRGDVLLVDRHEVGAVQTSACGTPLWVPRWLGVESSVLQVHDRLDLRTPGRTISYDLRAIPFCTFDYRAFARGLLAQSTATFLKTVVLGLEDGAVRTTAGRFTAPVIVDASGWRGVLVNGPAPAPPERGGYSFGLEAPTPLADDKLTFVVDRRVVSRGLGWVFPVGRGSLIGLGSYAGASRLGPALRVFLADLGAPPAGYHGTFFPSRLGRPTVRRLFAVGDAAGQCLPLTAEGIRPAPHFGDRCGELIRRVLAGELALDSALADHRRLVLRHRHASRR